MGKNHGNVRILVLIIGLSALYPCFVEERSEDVIIGEYLKLPSEVLGEDFTYFVHLPTGYAQSRKEYPVLYVLNAQTTATVANALATVESLSFELIPEMILIGLCNTGKASEYLPVKPDGTLGKAETFLEFLRDEFLPHTERTYRTARFRILMGQSNTGFFTIYVLCASPDTFQAYIAASPSLGWGLEFMKKKADEAFSEDNRLKSFLYMNYGNKDYKDLVIDPVQDFAYFLEKKAPSGLDWHLECLEKDGHVPVPSLNNGLLCLFPDYFLSDEQREKGLDWVDEHYKKLSMIYGFRLAAPEEVLFFLSHAMKRKGDLEAAIALLKVLVNRYPSSSRGYYFLGEAYREKHELQKAIEYYIKALDIDPDFVAARRRLEGLKRH